MTRTEPGAAEYAALTDALTETRVPCEDDRRYLLDKNDIDSGDLIQMRARCRTCPLRALCDAYATVARPPAGMWAGRHYNASRHRTHEKETHQ